jgi:dTDP-4-dehydrorhamnose reductase
LTYLKKRVLITGGSGLLALNWALEVKSHAPVFLGLHKRHVDLPGVNSLQVKLESVDGLARILEAHAIDLVVHTVGLTSIEQCESDPALANHVNVTLTKNVAKACALIGVGLVHISTDHLFSGEDSLVDELWKPEPKNTYALTKAAAESQVLDVLPLSLVVRTNFYGWGPKHRQSFSDVIINTLCAGLKLPLFHDVFYTPILAEALVHATYDLLDTKASGIYHIVGDERISKLEFGYRIAEEFDLDKRLIESISIADCPALVQRPRDMSLSNQKARDRLNRDFGTQKSQIARLRVLAWQKICLQSLYQQAS